MIVHLGKSASFLAMVALGICTGCAAKTETDSRPTNPTGGSGPPPTDLRLAKPDLAMSADEFFAKFNRSSPAEDAKHKGKTFELVGTVEGFRGQSSGDAIVLKSTNWSKAVTCFMAERNPWKDTVPENEVRIRGRFVPGGLGTWEDGDSAHQAYLTDCIFLETGKVAPQKTTAGQLAREFMEDEQKAKAKYDQQWLVITGEVASNEENRTSPIPLRALDLKGTEGATIRCGCQGAHAANRARTIGRGQVITLLGQCSYGEDMKIRLYTCVPFSEEAKKEK